MYAATIRKLVAVKLRERCSVLESKAEELVRTGARLCKYASETRKSSWLIGGMLDSSGCRDAMLDPSRMFGTD